MIVNTALGALSYLSSVCDGAGDRDGQGFSGSDWEFGKDLARKGAAYGLSEKQHAAAKRLAHKYRKQLRSAGFDLDAIAAEEWTAPAGAAKQPEAARVVPPAFRLDAFPNRYAGRCCGCGARVAEGHGVAGRLDSGKWATRCTPTCGLPQAADADPAVDRDHADPAYWRHCAHVERQAGNTALAAELEAQAAQLADPLVRIRVVDGFGRDLSGQLPAA